MSTRSNRVNVIGATTAGLIVVAFCLLLLWHDPLVFWNDDYELSILPVFADVARSWSEGHWPLLSPSSWVCSNLAGEFQYGTFSIFVNAAVVLIWKFPLTFPQQAAALSITHLFVLAAGAFLLARDRNFSLSLSIFVALIAALNGWIICWGASDWFGALSAFAWLPWAWWGLERALDRQRSRWRFLWPAPFVYLVVTGGFPYTVLMLALLVAWLSIKSLGQTKSPRSTLPMLFGAALGFALSASAWLAIFDYVHGSAREVQAPDAHWQWLVPLASLPGFILPCWTVNWADFSARQLPHTATELASGLVAPAALVAGFIRCGLAFVGKIKWELALLFLVLLLAMLPMVSLFRWSFRWLPFFYLILAICAAESLDFRPRSAVAALTALVAIVLIAVMAPIFRVGGPHALPLTWIFLLLSAVWVLAEFLLANEFARGWMPACITFTALLATYLCIPPNCGVPKYNLAQELTKVAPLDPQRLYLSVYPPPETSYRVEKKPGPFGELVRPGSTSMWAGLRFVNGYSPIRPAGVAREFDFAIHGEINPHVAEYLLWSQAAPNGLLAQLGIDGLVVAREVDIDPRPGSEWKLVASTDEGRVYHRIGAPFERVRSITSIDSRPNKLFATAAISRIDDSRNYVNVDVDVPNGGDPALVCFSRPHFPGYKAWLGNQKLAVSSYRGLFPLVELPAGSRGRLVLEYRPWWLVFGSGVAICGGAIFIACVVAAAATGSRVSN